MEKLLRATLPNGAFTCVPLVRSRTMAAIKGKHNLSTDIQFRMALVRMGIKNWVTHSDLPGKPDVYFPKKRLAIFLDGCFWHGCNKCGHIPKTNSLFWATKLSRTKSRDAKTTRLLRKQGIDVIRVWEHSLKNNKQMIKILHAISRYNSQTESPGNNVENEESTNNSKPRGRTSQTNTRVSRVKLLHGRNGFRLRP